MRKLLAGCYAVLLVVAVAVPAVASQPAPPRYQSSEPSDGATVHQPPDRVEVTFDQPLDDSSSLGIKDECGRTVDDGSTEVDGNSMSIGVAEKPSGDYHVEYTAVGLGGLTGRSEGHFTFTAHGGKPCDGGKNDHDDHDDDDENDHDDHGDKDHDSDRHDDDDHSTTTDHGSDHSSSDGDHTEHDSAMGTHDGSGHSGGSDGNHDEHSGDGKAQAGGDVPGITSPDDTSRKLLSRADSSTLLLSLGLCLLLGVLGGAILRTSGVR